MKVVVTGSCGYVGSMLIPALLNDGHEVTGYDTCYFGDDHWPHEERRRARLFKDDIRNLHALKEALRGQEAVIHLACISNDTSCQLDEKLSTSINYDAFEPLVIAAKEAGVRRFIYCSSSSVYGISEAPDVFEDHPLVPLTLYNKYKGMCEPLLLKHQAPGFTCTILRPATVCGPAPRMRFDLTVNIMTMHAIKKGKITVFGGSQKRPNLHIRDMVDIYRLILKAPTSLIAGEVFNVGRQNLMVAEIAEIIRHVVEEEMFVSVPIVIEESRDNRSYHINSDKLAQKLNWKPKKTIEDAIRGICSGFAEGKWQDALTNPIYTNIGQYIGDGVY